MQKIWIMIWDFTISNIETIGYVLAAIGTILTIMYTVYKFVYKHKKAKLETKKIKGSLKIDFKNESNKIGIYLRNVNANKDGIPVTVKNITIKNTESGKKYEKLADAVTSKVTGNIKWHSSNKVEKGEKIWPQSSICLLKLSGYISPKLYHEINNALSDITIKVKTKEGTIKRKCNDTFIHATKKESMTLYTVFGRYPQDLANEEVARHMRPKPGFDGYQPEYYLSNKDTEKYEKVIAKPYRSLRRARFSNNKKIKRGKAYYFKVKPIKWEIVEGYDKRILFMRPTCILDIYEPNNNSYSDSGIKTWVENKFKPKAFYKREYLFLIRDRSAPIYIPRSNDVKDKTFGDSAREYDTTDYAKAKGVYTDSRGKGYWWIRNDRGSKNRRLTSCIDSSGELKQNVRVKNKHIGVLPILKGNPTKFKVFHERP